MFTIILEELQSLPIGILKVWTTLATKICLPHLCRMYATNVSYTLLDEIVWKNIHFVGKSDTFSLYTHCPAGAQHCSPPPLFETSPSQPLPHPYHTFLSRIHWKSLLYKEFKYLYHDLVHKCSNYIELFMVSVKNFTRWQFYAHLQDLFISSRGFQIRWENRNPLNIFLNGFLTNPANVNTFLRL